MGRDYGIMTKEQFEGLYALITAIYAVSVDEKKVLPSYELAFDLLVHKPKTKTVWVNYFNDGTGSFANPLFFSFHDSFEKANESDNENRAYPPRRMTVPYDFVL
jgi:hypothetical protein